MSLNSLTQPGLLIAEAITVCALLLWFFRLRHAFGLAPLYITLGSFQHLQTLLASSLFVQVLPGVTVSPGSTVLFAATLFAVLLVYIREDAGQARSLIVGIVAANVTLAVISLLMGLHIDAPAASGSDPMLGRLLTQNLFSFMVGTGTLILDVILIIVLYEMFFRLFPRSLFLRILAAMSIVLVIDTLVFVNASFRGNALYSQILWSGLIGKSAAAVIYSLMLTGFLRWFQSPRTKHDDESHNARDMFHILTYRQRYDLLKTELSKDAMTGLYNRGFFNHNLDRELERAARLGHELCLVMLDIDHFKSINDNYGHQVGDDVIVTLADAIGKTFRSADLCCRYGGEEFVVIMPDANTEGALAVTTRLQRQFADSCRDRRVPVSERITFTAGIASYPLDGDAPETLLRTADERLYQGKRGGRDRIETRSADVVLST